MISAVLVRIGLALSLSAVLAGADVDSDGHCSSSSPMSRGGRLLMQTVGVETEMTAETYKVAVTPQSLMVCEAGEPAIRTMSMTRGEYQDIVSAYRNRMVRGQRSISSGVDEATAQERLAHFAGCVLRMAGHDFMDFVDGIGGSDACTDMDDADNAGLIACLSKGDEEWGDSTLSMYAIYQNFCTTVSLADFIVISAQAVMTILAPEDFTNFLGRQLRNNFRFGRVTRDEDCVMPHHILPNPDNSCSDVERVFVNNMGLTWRAATALMGVHSLGSASVNNSGFDGFWDTVPHSASFNNHYYVNMLATSWCPEQVAATGKFQWRRCEQLEQDQTEHVKNQMMLNTDLCLAFTAPNGIDVLSAIDTPCCTWVHSGVEDYPMGDVIRNNDNLEFCAVACPQNAEPGSNEACASRRQETAMCCSGDSRFQPGETGPVDCGTPGLGRDADHARQGAGKSTDQNEAVLDFASSADAWYEAFIQAWFVATENGATGLTRVFRNN